MSQTWLLAGGIAILVVIGYVLWLLGMFRQSRELDRKIDLSKMRKVQDDDRND
jgi:hypothetical protein